MFKLSLKRKLTDVRDSVAKKSSKTNTFYFFKSMSTDAIVAIVVTGNTFLLQTYLNDMDINCYITVDVLPSKLAKINTTVL